MKGILILITITSLSINVFGQNQHIIDSLNKELRRFELIKQQFGVKTFSISDSSKANILTGLSYEYGSTNFDTAIYYAQQSLSLSEKIGYKKGIGKAYYTMGIIYYYKENYDLSLEYYQKAIKIYQELGFKKGLVNAYNNIAGISYNKMNYPSAIEYYQKSLKINEELGDKKAIVVSNTSIGFAYTNEANYPEALKYYLKRLKLNEEIGDKPEIEDSYNDLGFVYSQLKNYPDAIKYYTIAITKERENKDTSNIGETTCNLGWVYLRQGSYKEALENELESLKIGEKGSNTTMIAYAYSNIGDIYLKKGDIVEALKNLFKALSLYKTDDKGISPDNYNSIGIAFEKLGKFNDALKYELKGLSQAFVWSNKTMIQDSYEELARINAKMQNYKAAYDNEVLFKQYYDTIYNKENEKKLTSLQMKYDFDKVQDSTKAEQDKKDLISVNEIKRQKNVRNYTLAGLGVVLLFSIVVFRQRNKISKEKKRSDDLLLNILPEEVADELKEKGSADAKMFDDVTVMFTDFKGFTAIAEKLSAKDLVGEINYCFSSFDNIIHKYGIEKIKTIGDAYMAAGGLPVVNKTHAKDVVNAAIEINKFMEEHKQQRLKEGKEIFEIRIGIHTGPVVAGIVGIKKFAYDIWGDTVNLASRMESSGEAGKVNISGSTYELVKNDFKCINRGKIQAKNKGEVDMYFVS
jgi:adenylate cyclase